MKAISDEEKNLLTELVFKVLTGDTETVSLVNDTLGPAAATFLAGVGRIGSRILTLLGKRRQMELLLTAARARSQALVDSVQKREAELREG